jgi:cysteinyl-tRNA synthetase
VRLHNTATRRKEVFVPRDASDVRLYLCGPTVYDRAHLGNARPVMVFDVLVRLLREVYGADAVTYVRNFTDVDDKINARAMQRRDAGDPRPLVEIVRAITDETIDWYHADMDALGAVRPDHEPRATDYIPQMVAMIGELIAKGHAYEADGHVLFSVASYPEYGRLSGRSVEDMIAGARVEVAPFKRDPMDFVLWKPAAEDEPGWPSPWSRGRPGWHIECSAMSRELLTPSFDIHGGGNDLMFPHHENEIAQSCCADPGAGFAQVWLHNEMLQVEGKKMSKSLGNFFTVRDLLDRGVSGEVIRFVFLSTHYRKPMDWTAKKAEEAKNALDYWASILRADEEVLSADLSETPIDPEVMLALADDLNTSLALTRLWQMARHVNNSPDFLASSDEEQLAQRLCFAASAEFLGFPIREIARKQNEDRDDPILDHLTHVLAFARIKAKETKDFSEVDRLKAALVAAGVEVRMSKDEVELIPGAGFDPAQLEALK